ncbi:tripartite motif-containing protein 16-like [Lampris incognitus]|uniref:tripartite motif-containing protein 16-like n=1 Tax=Lampris incognitus TaxID=2546036 RepID=UPI0024B59650|nr:tripartite motif-containing protein 16-like [Lampris incognitus]
MEGSRDGHPRQPRRPKRSRGPVEASGSPARAKRSGTSTARQPCEHPGHQTVPADEARTRTRRRLPDSRREIHQMLQNTQQMEREKLRRDLKRLRERAKDATDHCESILVSVIDSLQRGYRKVKELIEAREAEAEAQIQRSLQRRRDVEPRHLSHPSRAPLSESERAPAVSEEPFAQLFKPIEEAVEKFGRRLEDLCDEEIPTICQTVEDDELFQPSCGPMQSVSGDGYQLTNPGPSTGTSRQTGPSADPKTRAEFLKYAYELTLDPNTAHKYLDVSNGDKEVQRGPQKECRQVLPNPVRFSLRTHVLCTEALPAGRCYYEVEVDGDQAEIGLTYKGIHRKSLTSSSAFGGNDKSWSLDCSNGYSVSHRDKSVQLTAARRHRRIGVFLKSREGTLSFYEVSEDVELLHTVETTFKESLYAGFRLGENCRIRLCDLRREEP